MKGGQHPLKFSVTCPCSSPEMQKSWRIEDLAFHPKERKLFKNPHFGFPWCPSGEVSACQYRDPGLISSQGRFHMPQVSLSLSTTALEPVIYKRSHSNEKSEHLQLESSPCSLQLEKACMQQPNSSLAKEKNHAHNGLFRWTLSACLLLTPALSYVPTKNTGRSSVAPPWNTCMFLLPWFQLQQHSPRAS